MLLLALSPPPRLVAILKGLLLNVVGQAPSCPSCTPLQVVVSAIRGTRERIPLVLLIVLRGRIFHHAFEGCVAGSSVPPVVRHLVLHHHTRIIEPSIFVDFAHQS